MLVVSENTGFTIPFFGGKVFVPCNKTGKIRRALIRTLDSAKKTIGLGKEDEK